MTNTTAPNLSAIKRWFAENRKDIEPSVIDTCLRNDAFLLIAAGSFEAGRQFQMRNPDAKEFLEFGKEYE